MILTTLSSLPPMLRYRLMTAASGKHHLVEIGQHALIEAEKCPEQSSQLLHLAKEVFTAAWMDDPLDGTVAADLAEFDRRLPGLTPAGKKCVHAAASLCAVSHSNSIASKLSRLEKARDYEKLSSWLQSELKLSPANGFLAWSLYHHALDNMDFARARLVADHLSKITPLAPAGAKLLADAWFLDGEYEQAAAAYSQAEEAFPGMCSDRIGEALHRMGKTTECIETLTRLISHAPWRVNSALRLHDIATEIDHYQAPLPGSTAVLFYSYNNAAKLDQTLQSLHESMKDANPNVLIRVLSNGSQDGTKGIIEKWKNVFGDIFGSIFLPINVGAPAARNWLASLPEIKACDFVAYLDDDVWLPQDWLSRFGAAVETYPDAGLWGCRVTDFKKQIKLQQVDLNVLPPKQGDFNFSMTEAHLSGSDFGQFSYLRPTSSVTGCCHLFRSEALQDSGEFDLCFSPTQYDDLDHDLRLCLMKKSIIYQGHLAVEHMKMSGSLMSRAPAAISTATANMYKLKHKYSEAEVRKIQEQALTVLEADFSTKMAKLGLPY